MICYKPQAWLFRVLNLYCPCCIIARQNDFFERVFRHAYTWLEIVNLFQTFEDLESVKDKQADIQAVRQVIDEDTSAEAGSH